MAKAEQAGYLLRPCKSTAAFEALPNAGGVDMNLDLPLCRELLQGIGYKDVCDAGVMQIMKKEIEVTVYPSGKLILKTDSEDTAKRVMNEIYDKILMSN